ncbi:MAG: bifunctional glutamate N-acetyltransferase/amino-acid acetyltransferase ArgJ [Thermoguttaceae bacterium]
MNTESLKLPQGFSFAGVHAGLKNDPALLDLSLIATDFPATAAGVYTTTACPGGHVQCDRQRTPRDGFRAVAINSRVSNSCTGEQGYRDAITMSRLASNAVGGGDEDGLCMSTGVIGVMLPMDKIAAGIAAAAEKLAATPEAFLDAARGMMTTDTVEKFVSRTVKLPRQGRDVALAGMCKGAAMIGPNMATMLAIFITDAKLTPQDSQTILKQSVDVSFNCVSVEGHMSTCDTVLFLANGAASDVLDGDDLATFSVALKELCIELAKQIPQDGEGATHFVTIDVNGCRTRAEARQIAKTVAESALVKTAIYGADPNWGRIVSAAGYAGVPFDIKRVGLVLNGIPLFQNGAPQPFDAAAVSRSIREHRNTDILLTFGEGDQSIRFWTTDLTPEYVHLNADYTT